MNGVAIVDAATNEEIREAAPPGSIFGPDRDRTGDLMNAIHARSQLRYWPARRTDKR